MNVNRKLTSLAALAVLATGAFAHSAPAAEPLAATKASLSKERIAKQDYVRVVFRTATALPRRADGAIRAGVALDGVNHSIGTLKRGTSCYTALVPVKGGSIATLRHGQVARKGARAGRAFTVKVFTRDGQSATRTVKLQRAGKLAC